MTWEDAVAFALGLPGAELSTSYGKPAVMVKGRAFLATGHEPGSFCILIDRDTVDMLMATDPATYWQTPHYAGYPAVLVRFDSDDPDRVRQTISHARDWNAARPALRPRKKK